MPTKWTCRPASRSSGRRARATFAVIVALLAGLSAGCGQLGKLGYFAGVGRGTKIKPHYTLPKNVLLVLVDDPGERVTSPETTRALAERVGDELLRAKAVEQVIRPSAVARLRQVDMQFHKLSAAAVGEKVGADTVLWLEVREFFAPKEIEDTASAARMTVSVKVLNVHEREKPSEVRLWPDDPHGHIVEAQLKAVEVNELKNELAIARALADKSAVAIGRLFYEHTLGDIEDDK